MVLAQYLVEGVIFCSTGWYLVVLEWCFLYYWTGTNVAEYFVVIEPRFVAQSRAGVVHFSTLQ